MPSHSSGCPPTVPCAPHIPTTIGASLSAIGIAGMDRLVQRNVLATSGRAVEAAGDVSTLLLDKTGTITFGNRKATELIPVGSSTANELARAARLSSLADGTPEGRSILELVTRDFGLPDTAGAVECAAEFVPFSAQTRMSGITLGGHDVREGATASVRAWVRDRGGEMPVETERIVDEIGRQGGTHLVVAESTGGEAFVRGVIRLSDVVKPGMRERFVELRSMGIRTVMITGDNPLTAKAIAEDAGVDDYLAEAVRRSAVTSRDDTDAVVETGSFTINLAAKKILLRDGTEVHLTKTEWSVLEVLVRHRGCLVAQKQLLHDVWGPSYETESHYLRVYLAQLRRKLEPEPSRPRHLLTETGMGYRFEV